MSQDTFILHIMPEQKCTASRNTCERMTNYAEADIQTFEHGSWNNELVLHPRCYEHGYFSTSNNPTQAERGQEYASVERYVIGSHDGRGRAKVIGPCSLSDVPTYEPRKQRADFWHIEDKAWYVRYELEQSTSYLYVTWSYDAAHFTTWEARTASDE